MRDFLVAFVILLILGLAVFAIYKSKKSGKKCIGCPDSGSCQGCHCKK